jgi:hypothetical protein
MKYRLFLISAVALLALTACQKEMEVYPRCFSVSETTQVFFSPGNLKYSSSLQKYSFHANQYDYIGAANRPDWPSYNGDIDLFGWGTGDDPMKRSSDAADYANYVEWGSKLDEAGWRTLTFEEWNYLLQKRPNANKLYGTCSIENSYGNDKHGMVILPDTWDCDTIPVKFTREYNQIKYSSELWKKMEKAGAVFLPAAGNIVPNLTGSIRDDQIGRYWSSSPAPMNCAFFMGFVSVTVLDGSRPFDGTLRCNGRSVRLVKDITSPSQIPAAK